MMNVIPKPEFPRPDRQRARWLNLNGKWDFMLFAQGTEDQEKQFAAQRGAYTQRITVPFTWTCDLSGIGVNVPGIGWYRREVSYQPEGRLFLCFGAVDYAANVYVNGEQVCSHQGGYDAFETEVTGCWQAGDNVIEVRAEDYRRETQLYGKQGYGEIQGIWQTVWLEERPEHYIRDFRFTTLIDGTVWVNADADAPDGTVLTACFDGCERSGAVRDGKASIKMQISNPRLWSPDDPYLYEGKLRMGTDEVGCYFGIREIGTATVKDKDFSRIMLNGKPIYLNGTLDQAFNPEGYFTYPSEEAIRDEVWRLKRIGLNMARIHIKAEEPRKLYWMDKLGILVMADVPCHWGSPTEEARAAYEREMPRILSRDKNHPSIFSWVIFNESWGLLQKEPEHKDAYFPETQEWVRKMYRLAKYLEPDRLVEDNSACRYDHVESDLNTWHFYLNGYETVRDMLKEVTERTYPGSGYNYIGQNLQNGAPLMNSECGMVWGVENSAGDSDLAWNYHYMLNEYRLHEKICGFIFTEFHDVVNEFNGYYRIDGEDKDFGYQGFCEGMSLRDLHAKTFMAIDCAPMQTVAAGETTDVSLVLSNYDEVLCEQRITVEWELWHEGIHGRAHDLGGKAEIAVEGYGTAWHGKLLLKMPDENAVAILSLWLKDQDGNVLSRNFTTFDVRKALGDGFIEIPATAGRTDGFAPVWTAIQEQKLCMGGSGSVSYAVKLPEGVERCSDMILHFEAGAKRVLSKDRDEIGEPEKEHGFMRGYLVDRGAFENSYWMTDESRFPSIVHVLVDGSEVQTIMLQNDWADSRGTLSWHYQPETRHLDEAGSYGEAQHIAIPSRLIPDIVKNGGFTLTFEVDELESEGGLALYGRNAGRYPFGLTLEIR